MNTPKITPEKFYDIKSAIAKLRKNSNFRTIGKRFGISSVAVGYVKRFVDYADYRDFVTNQCKKIKKQSKQLKLKTIKKFEPALPIENRAAPEITPSEVKQLNERLDMIIKNLNDFKRILSDSQEDSITALQAMHEDYRQYLEKQLSKRKVIW